MKVGTIGLKQAKITSLDEQFPVQDMLLQTGQIEQFASGIFAYGHIPFLVKKNIDKIISDTLTKYGCAEISLPLLQPESIWAESGRLERYVSEDVMFQTKTKNGNFCLAPTAEEAVVAFARSRLTTYKQLPTTYFQIGQKFRNEIRCRGYLLRGKSFDMMDAYSFGKSKAELDTEYDNMKQAYLDIFSQLGLTVQPVGADSGAIGGSKSEEFMCIADIGEDNIMFDKTTGKAFNQELLEKENPLPYLTENYGITSLDNLETRKAVELGHIFQLGDKYSKTMKGYYVDQNGATQPYIMGCYGIGVSRTLAMVYEANAVYKNGKFDGISLPKNLSPYLAYFIPKTDDQTKFNLATTMYNQLEQNGIKVLFDDRQDMNIGAKIKDAKMTGVPYIVVFGNSLDRDELEIESTKTGEKITVAVKDFANKLAELNK